MPIFCPNAINPQYAPARGFHSCRLKPIADPFLADRVMTYGECDGCDKEPTPCK